MTNFDKIDTSFIELAVYAVCIANALQRLLLGPWKGPCKNEK